MHIRAVGKLQRIGQHRREHRQGGIALRAETVAGMRKGYTRHGADIAGGHLLGCGEFAARVQPQLIDLFLFRILRGRQHLAHTQTAARHLHKGQAVALRVARDLVYLRAEMFAVSAHLA